MVHGRPGRCSGSTSRPPESTVSTMCGLVRPGAGARRCRGEELVGTHRPGPRHTGRGRPRCTGSRPSRRVTRVCLWRRQSACSPMPWCRPAGGGAAGGDEARLRPHDGRDAGRAALRPGHRREGGGEGPVLDAGVIDRHFDPERRGRRTLVDLCGHYGIEIAHAHDASVDAIASMECALALASRPRRIAGVRSRPDSTRPDRLHREWPGNTERVARPQGMIRWTLSTTSGPWSRRPCRRRPDPFRP